jgi:hypothetical protein
MSEEPLRITGDAALQAQTMVLSKLRVAGRMRIGPQLLHDMKYTQMLDHLTGDLIAQIETTVLAEQIGGEDIVRSENVVHELSVIDGRWQRFKDRHRKSWWLGWFVSWRPPRTITDTKRTTVTLRVGVKDYAAFPQNTRVYPEELGAVVYQRHTSAYLWARDT